MAEAPDRLAEQVRFIVEIDKLKHVLRQTWLTDGSRRENDAEHSWHMALMAVLLREYADEAGLDLFRVLTMLLVHDLVEIDAGDTFAYDEAGHGDKAERERRAADRLFRLLPSDQGRELRALWDEFEARETPEARYAAALDRLQPLLLHMPTEGKCWRSHGVTADQVLERCSPIGDSSSALWAYAQRLIREAVERGYLAPAPE